MTMKMNKVFKIIFVICLIALPVETICGQCASIYRKAELLMEKGKYKDAISNFKAAMQCDNNLTESCKAKIAECEKKIRNRTSKISNAQVYGLTIDKDTIVFDYETTSNKIVRVQSIPEKWTAVSNKEWCKILPLENKISVSCEINNDTNERKATENVSNDKKNTKIVVIPKGKKIEEYIKFDIDKLEFSGKGEIKEIFIDTNAKWEVIDIAEWCEVIDKNDNRLILKTETANKKREGTLILKTSTGKIASLIISQKKKPLF